MHTATESRFPSHAAGFAPLPTAARRWEEPEAWREGFHAITGVAFEAPQARKPLPLVRKEATVVPASDGDRKFKIRAAHSTNHRGSASMLIDRMYATRGYLSSGLPTQPAPNRVTLMACEHEEAEALGTITVGFDSPDGLHVDELFREEVDALRILDRRVCEFTKLAMDSIVRSKRVLASLFHVAYIYARRIHRYQDLLIEVNPRHVKYYERMLGFVRQGPERLCPRVNAPAVLMALDLSHAESQIARFGGRHHLADSERSLYPHFFSLADEADIVRRLRAA
ncbi:MAG: N-acyl amino acid synthase FeeM domain-containing protein [Rhizobacter sp.]